MYVNGAVRFLALSVGWPVLFCLRAVVVGSCRPFAALCTQREYGVEFGVQGSAEAHSGELATAKLTLSGGDTTVFEM